MRRFIFGKIAVFCFVGMVSGNYAYSQWIKEVRVYALQPNRSVTIKSDRKTNNYLIPQASFMQIKFEALPDSTPRLMKNGVAGPQLSVAGDSTFALLDQALPREIGARFAVRWWYKNQSHDAVFTIYPIPTVQCLTQNPRLGDEVSIQVGPLLRQPDSWGFQPLEIIGGVAQVVKTDKFWNETDRFIQMRCIFDRQPGEYKLIIFDRLEPSMLLYPTIRPFATFETIHEPNDYTEIYLKDFDLPNFQPYSRPTFKLRASGAELNIAREGDRIDFVEIAGTDNTVPVNSYLQKIRAAISEKGSIGLYSSSDENTIVAVLSGQSASGYRLEVRSICDRAVFKLPKGSGAAWDYADAIFNVFRTPDLDFKIKNPTLVPGDTLKLEILATSNQIRILRPVLGELDKELMFNYLPGSGYETVIPTFLNAGTYPIYWKTIYSAAKIPTGRSVTVKEFAELEQISKLVTLNPASAADNFYAPALIEPRQVKDLSVELDPRAIGHRKGPQFLKIKMTAKNTDGSILALKEIRTVIFNPDDERGKDEINGPYASFLRTLNPNAKPFWTRNSVPLKVENLPSWSTISVEVTPDDQVYNIPYSRDNEFIRHYRVKGPRGEVVPSLGAPKVLFPVKFYGGRDKSDSLDYGSASVMLKFFRLSETGNRSWWSVGLGVYGLNASSNLVKGGGVIPFSASGDLLELFRKFGFKVPETTQITLDGSLFIPFGYPYARFLFSLTVSLTP